MPTTLKLTRKLAIKVRDIVDVGLTTGKGDPVAGQLCVEAAVSLAMGLPHSDRPPCVGSAVRTFKIALNDLAWTSDKARAKGMRGLAIAQLGSDTIDQNRFAELLAIKCTNKIVPIALRAAAKLQNKVHKEKLQACALECEAQTTVEGSKKAANAANAAANAVYAAGIAHSADHSAVYAAGIAHSADHSAANAAAYAAANAAAYAAVNAANAASIAHSAAYAAVNAANAASIAHSAAYAAVNAANAASIAHSAAYAANAAAKDKKEYDRILTIIADSALEVLIELKSPGCKWLSILKTNAKE